MMVRRNPRVRVVVLTPAVGGMGGIARLTDSIAEQLQCEPDDRLHVTYVSTRGNTSAAMPFVFLSAFVRVLLFCLSGRCDVLHINLASSGSTYRKLFFSAIARVTGTPYVVHLHGGMYREFWDSRPRWMKRLIDALFINASRIIVLGAVWADMIRERLPATAARITVVPNGVKMPDPAREPQERAAVPMVLFLGKLVETKGIMTLLDALAKLPARTTWRAVLAGDGDVDKLRARARMLGIAGQVSFPGWVDRHDAERLLREAEVFVLPSLIENLPLSVMEAFSHRVPVVCTPVGAVPEMVTDRRTGLLVPVNDADRLADAITNLLEDPDLRRRLSSEAYEVYASRFELSGYVRRLATIWKSVASAEDTSDTNIVRAT